MPTGYNVWQWLRVQVENAYFTVITCSFGMVTLVIATILKLQNLLMKDIDTGKFATVVLHNSCPVQQCDRQQLSSVCE